MLQATEKSPAKVTEKTDVYSFGILVWEILTKKKAYAHHSAHGSFNHFRQAILIGERPPIPSYCIPKLRSFLQSCWAATALNRPSFKQVVEELEEIVKEYNQIETQQEIQDDIGDACAASFWYDAFGQKETVHWLEFCDALCLRLACDFLCEDSTSLKCFQEIAIGRYNDEISRKQFGSILSLLGPIEFPYSNSENHFLDKIENLLKIPYFFGVIDSREAEILLRNESANFSYLLRVSNENQSKPKFCISYFCENDTVKHIYFTFNNGLFYCNNNQFHYIPEIIDALNLTNPCNTDKFVYLFVDPYQTKLRTFTSANNVESNVHEDPFQMDFMLTK